MARRQLTPRQQEVLRLEALGRTIRQIARVLGLSEAGVRRHIEHIVQIHPDCAKQANRVRLAVELGLISPWEDFQPPRRRTDRRARTAESLRGAPGVRAPTAPAACRRVRLRSGPVAR